MGGSPDDNLAAASPAGGSNWGHFVAPSAEELNELLPQFEVIELIGQGGMGAVYRAKQTRLDRMVAIKLLPPFGEDDGSHFAERFEREARAMAMLNHPNIVTVHDYGETDRDHRYFVMEYVDGSDLHTLIQGGQLTTKHALGWMPYICSAIRYAHEKGVIHRDIKPANVLISREGDVKVGDFGLAKLVGHSVDRSITQTQVSMGTPDYAAPEALDEGGQADHRSDIYSLGVLFYEMLTGKVPRGAWKPPSQLKDVDVRLDNIIIKAMQPDADQRYNSVAEIEEALGELRNMPKLVASRPAAKKEIAVPLPSEEGSGGKPVKVTRASGTKTTAKKDSNSAVVAIVAVAAVAAAMMGVLVFRHYTKPRPTDLTPNAPLVEETISTPDSTLPAVGSPDENDRPGTRKPPVKLQSPPAVEAGWVSLMGTLTPDANRKVGDWLLTRDKARSTGKDLPSVIQFPMKTADAYEVALTLERTKKPGGSAILLPVGKREVALVFSSILQGKNDQTPILYLAKVDEHGASDPRNPTRTTLDLKTGESHELQLRVIARNGKATIVANIDGKEVLKWVGNESQLSLGDTWRVPDRPSAPRLPNTVGIVTQTELVMTSATLRTLEPSATPDRDKTPEKSVAETKPTKGKDPMQADPASKPPMPTEPETAADVRLQELHTGYDLRLQEEVLAPYEKGLTDLNILYESRLNDLITKAATTPDEELKAQAEEELARLKSNAPLPESDPIEIRVDLAKLRGIYREQLAKLSDDQDTARLPVLQAKMEDLQALRQEFVFVEDLPSAEVVLKEMEALQPKLDELMEEETLATELPLKRPEFPRARPLVRGKVIAWSREATSLPSTLLEVPAGLSSSVSAIAGGNKLAVALKSSGTVVGWGGDFDESLKEELETLTRITYVDVAHDTRSLHLAALDQDGVLRVVTRGWGDLADLARTLTSSISQPVDFTIGSKGGLALQVNGQASAWGEIGMGEEDVESIRSVVKLKVREDLQMAITEDATVLKWGPMAKRVPEELTKAFDIALSTHREMGGVALLPDNRVMCWGSFAQWQEDLNYLKLDETKTVEKIVAGNNAFAVRLSDESWQFFGHDLDVQQAGLNAAGCEDIVIAQDAIIGLQD